MKLVIGENGESRDTVLEDDINTIQHILKTNKNFLTKIYWNNNVIRSILHTAKYVSKRQYMSKQKIINAIVDVGYSTFKFSKNSVLNDKCHALFFVAAKSDLKQLKKIVEDLEENNASTIHDTRNGETILSFMIKFGNYLNKDFVDCFTFILHKGIDIERVDYFKKNVKEILDDQLNFLEHRNIAGDHMGVLKKIRYNINTLVHTSHFLDSKIIKKHNFFQAVIKNENIKEFLKGRLLDLDDGDNTLLQLAIIKENLRVAKELLDNGADPNKVVKGRNEDVPLVLAAKLGREIILKEMLNCKSISKRVDLKVDNTMFAIFVTQVKENFLNYLLEWKYLNVDIEYNGKTPLSYAIAAKNSKAIQSLLQRGARVDVTHLDSINPKDLEHYFDSCIKLDHFGKDMNNIDYKLFLVFDFFMTSPKKTTVNSYSDDTVLVISNEESFYDKFDSEVAILQNISDNERLKNLLEHPLVYIYIILLWQCVLKYYFFLIVVKSIFYILIDLLIYFDSFSLYIATVGLLIQILVVSYNLSKFKLELRKYTLNFIIECFILLFLILIFGLKLTKQDYLCNQISAFFIIFTSVSLQLTLGYHLKLSKWIAMIKRVFKSFIKLILFFMPLIIAFAMAFTLLFSINEKTKKSEMSNADFSNFFKAIFRIFVLLGGDIGEKQFTGIGSYILFLFFTIGVAIILLNFLTGIAVSDIKEIEEQSTTVAFNSVIEFIEDSERIYVTIFNKMSILKRMPQPFLKSKIYLKGKNKFRYGINFYINSQEQFENQCFQKCRIPKSIVSKIKYYFTERQ